MVGVPRTARSKVWGTTIDECGGSAMQIYTAASVLCCREVERDIPATELYKNRQECTKLHKKIYEKSKKCKNIYTKRKNCVIMTIYIIGLII